MRQRAALCDQKDPSDLGFSAPNTVMRLPLFLRDRTSPARSAMSEKCQNQKSAVGIRALAAFRIQKFANKGQEFCHWR